MRIKDFMDEAFNGIGKLSKKELAKGQRVDSGDDMINEPGTLYATTPRVVPCAATPLP